MACRHTPSAWQLLREALPRNEAQAAFVAVLSLLCLNGITHLLSMSAETLLLATLPTLVFPLIVMSLCTDLCPAGRQRFAGQKQYGHSICLVLITGIQVNLTPFPLSALSGIAHADVNHCLLGAWLVRFP
jgi:hypothetical protein